MPRDRSTIVHLKCCSCACDATYIVIRGDITARMCKRHAEEMRRNYQATISPIQHKDGRVWRF
jgi:hypothetical protein